MSVLLFDFQLHILLDAAQPGLRASCEVQAIDLEALVYRGMLREDATGSYRLTALGASLLGSNIPGLRRVRAAG